MSKRFRDELREEIRFTILDAQFWAIGAVIGLLALGFLGVLALIAWMVK